MAGETILLIDDEKQVTTLLGFILRKEGYNAIAANDGNTGIEMAREEKPSLILLDVMMPVLDGYEVCRAIRADERTRDIPVIMLTSLGMGKDVQKGMDSGASWYITKPFDRVFLLKHIRRLINKTEREST